MTPSLSVNPLFATSLAVTTLAPDEVPVLHDAITAARLGETVRAAPRPGQGWQSGDDMARWRAPAVAALSRRLVALAGQLTADVGAVGSPRYDWSVFLRGNILRDGESLTARHRPDAFWGGLCFIADGYGGSGDTAAGGEVEIEDPRLPATLMEAPDLRLRLQPGRDGTTYRETVRIRPAAGQLLLYPAWLRIAHRPFHGMVERIWITVDLVAHRRSVAETGPAPRSIPA
ncbi:putative 2OG-Fe(II) oxygenase [Sphingomonas solaris]|uniref:Uncharacterized protein n=1 Tax=Alterirhizorhabdus solaris TaxID=2529389 RepID=A0A558R531_9SPHN|nr:putative 2OG-Fe(II) oxygenase [Sphingomonas solaris]TVV74495.1 hypothetical protein FOY91_09520 [Sphingomonas solaris]